jgi:hypothetical protein
MITLSGRLGKREVTDPMRRREVIPVMMVKINSMTPSKIGISFNKS